MGRQRESRTSIAVLAFIVASAVAQFNAPSDLRDDCSDKADGTCLIPSPSNAPSTMYDMKTAAPPLEASNDGTVCTGTGRRSMGKCSSGFMQCVGGKLIARRCPGQSLFDDTIGLCVYDLDGCEMDVDVVDATEQETVPVTTSPLEEVPVGHDTQPVQTTPSTYTQQVAQDSSSQQEYSSSTSQQDYQREDSTQYQRGYQTGYQATPTEQYQTEYQPSSQHETVPVYSSFGDSSLPSDSPSLVECDIGSFRRVSVCSPSFDACSATARQWIKRVCGKSHRFDSSSNRCRPIFEVRECDGAMSSYIPPPVESSPPVVYSNPSTSFDYTSAVNGKEYEEKHIVDPFKGGDQYGRIESNPFIATGNSGSFYTEDGFSSMGSAWNEGGERRREREGRRSHKNVHHSHTGDYVIVSGNPFGGSGNRVVNDEWKGRKSGRKGAVRSSLTAARGHGVRKVIDEFEGRVSHFAPPLSEVNPFAVKRADGHRRRGRKNCRRDKHRRREDWDDYECDEKREKERPIARNLVELDNENEDERAVQIEESGNAEIKNESGDEEEKVEESEGNELEKSEETEDRNTDPELMPESIENEEAEETTEGVNEDEKNEEIEQTEETEDTTSKEEPSEEVDDNIEENEDEDGSMNGEDTSTDGGSLEEKAENEGEENENAVEELNEDTVAKEFEEDGQSEPVIESKNEDVDSSESVVNEEKAENDEERTGDGIEEEEKENETGDISKNEEERVEEDEENDVDAEETAEPIEEADEIVDEDGDKEKDTESIENNEETSNEEKNQDSEEEDESVENETGSVEDGENEEEKVKTEAIEKPTEGIAQDVKENETETAENELEMNPESIEGDVKEKEEVSKNTEVEEDDEKIEEEDELEDPVDQNDDVEETVQNENDETKKEEKEENGEETPKDGMNAEDRAENEGEENGNAVEELNEDTVAKEFEEDGDYEPVDERKNEDVDSSESFEKKNTLPGITMQFNENGEKSETKDEATPEESAENEFEMNPESLEGEVEGNVEETAKNDDNAEEKTEDVIEENGNAVEELNEDTVAKEFDEDGESEPVDESKNEDVDSSESVANEEKAENDEEKTEDGVEKENETGEISKNDEERVDEDEENAVNTEETAEPIEEADEIVDEDGDKEKETESIDKNGDTENEENNEESEENETESGEDGENEEEKMKMDGNESRRRRRSVVYDSSITNQSPPSTISRRLSIPRSSRLHRSRFSRLCSSSTAGHTISIGQCRQDFVYCKSARRPVVAACPVGDLFDAIMSTCVPTEMCGAEAVKGGTPTETTVVLPSSSPSRDGERATMPSPTVSTTRKTAIIDEEKNIDCSTLSDGTYTLSDCSSRYFVCDSSVKYSYKCPAGLIYHQTSCQWPSDVAACDGRVYVDVTSTETSSYSADSLDGDIIATTAPSTVSPMHVHFECTKDGGFALDCTGGFVMCSNGVASIMKCPPSLVFEEVSQACQYPAQIASCGLAVTSLDAPSTTSIPTTLYTSTPPTLPPYIHFTSTTNYPARAVETLVNTPVDKDACSRVSTGLEGRNEVCPSSFYICKEGQVITLMNCPDGTFFHDKTKQCDYREIACDGYVEKPVGQEMPSVSTESTEEYSRRASRPYRPLIPVSVEKIEKTEEVKRDEEKPVIIPSYIESAKEGNCDWKGAVSSGDCSSTFIVCTNGRPEVFDCTAGLIFASSMSACQYPESVPGCSQLTDTPLPTLPTLPTLLPSSYSSSSTSSPLSDAVIIENPISEYTREEVHGTTTTRPILPIKIGDHTSAKFEATGDACTFNVKQPAFPLNYCSMTYAVCTPDGKAYRTNCTFGYLFDSVIRQCVPSEHCGQPYMKEIGGASPPSFSPLHSMNHLSHDSRCRGVQDGTLKATSLCSAKYIRCEKESVVMVTCSSMAHVFSSLTGRCVLRVQTAECSSSPKGSSTPAITLPKMTSPSMNPSMPPSPSSPSYSSPSHRASRIRGGLSSPSSTPFDPTTFCTTKHSDGLYRHPENCAGIVQCFGGEVFSYPSCTPGLFFNEIDSQCDYASNVPECASQSDPISLDDSAGSCKGQPHGSHLADDSDCSIYYRCVWGSMERLTCPVGTVFNPRLSVCDYPSEVPHCQKQ